MGPFTTESHRDTQHALTAGLHDRRGGLGKDRGIGGEEIRGEVLDLDQA